MHELTKALLDSQIQAQVRRTLIKQVPSLQHSESLPRNLLDKLAELDRVVAEREAI